MNKNNAVINMVGMRVGLLTILEDAGTHKVCGARLWRVRCDCGIETIAKGTSMRRGQTRSCGCLKRMPRRVAKAWVSPSDRIGNWHEEEAE